MKTDGKWEKLDDGQSDSDSHRLKVPGGWIIRTVSKTFSRESLNVAQTFVPDPKHDWNI